MHEYSVVQALLARVERAARTNGATRVHKLRVSLGELAGIEPELFLTAWETFRERTICAEAPLELQKIDARWGCPRCELGIAKNAALRCTSCGGPAQLLQGDELVLESIELEIP
jgi:hydrogenase nickel incorporation protein HypA/HybF